MDSSLQHKSSATESSPEAGLNGFDSENSQTSGGPLQGYGIFSGVTQEKKLKADGTVPKRRGPKPDSKPALNRRQELNRQAQRTHRERKELYIKALEQEVLKFKETYGNACRDRDAFAEENRKLRELLAQNNINCPADLNPNLRVDLTPPKSATSSGSYSGSYDPPSMESDTTPDVDMKEHHLASPTGNGTGMRKLPDFNINVDQVGIDFVLALERPCMDHMQMLCVRSQLSGNASDHFSGHALMASCPPIDHITHHPDVQYPHVASGQVPDGDLLKLLDLSARLPLEGGEITPVMAWAYIFKDARFRQLSEDDILTIKVDLLAKVRCYGFGAVVEEFEVKDSLESVLAHKLEVMSVA